MPMSVHEKLVAMGFDGTDRTTRRAVVEAKRHFAGAASGVSVVDHRGGRLVAVRLGHRPDGRGTGDVAVLCVVAGSRFRVVIPVWDRTLPIALSCLDETFRRMEGIPTYVSTDHEKTVTAEHAAEVPIRHPDMAAAGRHYGTQITTCVPADPESKGGSEVTVKIAKADLVPTTANLREGYHSFAELRAEAAM